MTDKCIGLIPAAGKGVRLGLPYPKELYPIIRQNRYKPVSQFVVDNIASAGVKHVVFVINETKHQLMGYFGNGRRFGCHISYVVQENQDDKRSTSPGLAHALDAAYHLTRGKTVFFGMADTIMQPENLFSQLYQQFQSDDDVVLGLFSTTTPHKFGMVRLNKKNVVQEIVDKPSQTDLTLMWGCIIWRPSFSEHLHDCLDHHGLSDFAQIMTRAIGDGLRFRGFEFKAGSYLDLGTFDEIIELDKRFRED